MDIEKFICLITHSSRKGIHFASVSVLVAIFVNYDARRSFWSLVVHFELVSSARRWKTPLYLSNLRSSFPELRARWIGVPWVRFLHFAPAGASWIFYFWPFLLLLHSPYFLALLLPCTLCTSTWVSWRLSLLLSFRQFHQWLIGKAPPRCHPFYLLGGSPSFHRQVQTQFKSIN